jgi:long-subunit fatty acid transport protein
MDLDLHGSKLHPTADALLQQVGSAGLDVKLPQQYRFSAVHHLTADGLRDTWGIAVGLLHRIDPSWSVSGGIGYDCSPVNKDRAPIYFPVSDQLRLAMGAISVDHRF